MSRHQRFIKPGEMLAIDPKVIHQGPEAFFWLWSDPVKENIYIEDIACVCIRGPLEHHDEPQGGDSYDAISNRVREAFECDESKFVILCVDSPGGVVSGLNECVASIRRMKEQYRKPLLAFVDEMATSAAYALSCSCDEIITTKSGIVGSVGVISTMVDQVEYDKKQGFRFVTITSGTRKADGHPHVPINQDAVNAETKRVRKLANQFFGLVSRVRGVSKQEIEGYQAGIFLGAEAFRAGLVDGIMGKDELFSTLNQISLDYPSPGGSDFTRVKKDPQEGAPAMSATLAAVIKETEEAIQTEKDPKKRKALTIDLSALRRAYKKVKHTIEKHEEEEGEEDEDDEEEEEAKGNETDRKEDSDDDDSKDDVGDDDEDEDEDDDEEDDEEEAAASPYKQKSLVASLKRLTGKRSARAMMGVVQSAFAKATEYDRMSRDVKSLKARERSREMDALIAEGSRRGQFPNPKFAQSLKAQGLRTLKQYLAATKPGTFLTTQESVRLPPDAKRAVSSEDAASVQVTEEMMKAAKAAHMANPKVPVEKFLEAAQKAEYSRLNGQGRY